MTERAVSVAGVSKRYGKVVALDGLDLQVDRGSIVGLVGPNGAGKTTLIRLLVGALRPDSGTVRVLGRDPLGDKREVRATIGYMPQAPVLYQDLTVGENVSFFARGHVKDVARRVAAVVEFVDLGPAIDRPVGKLSGGQQQRASLASALVHEPAVLFLDEPTAGVDPELRHAFWLRFRELAEGGVTLVVSTHQMDEVAHCDRVTLLRAGRALAASTPRDLFAAGGATARVVTDAGETLEQHLASPGRDLPRLLHGMGLDPAVIGIEIEAPSLEDVILGLIEQQAGTRDP